MFTNHKIFHAVITKASRHSQDTQYAVSGHETAGSLDSLLLRRIFRAVIESQASRHEPMTRNFTCRILSLSLSWVLGAHQHCSTVANIAHVESSFGRLGFIGLQQDCHSCSTRCGDVLLL